MVFFNIAFSELDQLERRSRDRQELVSIKFTTKFWRIVTYQYSAKNPLNVMQEIVSDSDVEEAER